MGDPILIDDGGSIRIAQLRKKLDDLLDNNPAKAAGTFTKVTVISIDPESGVPNVNGPHPLNGYDVVISCDKGQKVYLRITQTGECTVEVLKSAEVEGKGKTDKRRYIIANGGVINKVNLGGGGNPQELFPGTPPIQSHYTMIYLTPA